MPRQPHRRQDTYRLPRRDKKPILRTIEAARSLPLIDIVNQEFPSSTKALWIAAAYCARIGLPSRGGVRGGKFYKIETRVTNPATIVAPQASPSKSRKPGGSPRKTDHNQTATNPVTSRRNALAFRRQRHDLDPVVANGLHDLNQLVEGHRLADEGVHTKIVGLDDIFFGL